MQDGIGKINLVSDKLGFLLEGIAMKRKKLGVVVSLLVCFSITSLAFGSPLEIVNSFSSLASTHRGLTWDGGYLWQSGGLMYKLDTSGNIVNQYNWSYIASYGMAFDGDFLWYVDREPNKMIYQPQVISGSATSSISTSTTIRKNISLTNNALRKLFLIFGHIRIGFDSGYVLIYLQI